MFEWLRSAAVVITVMTTMHAFGVAVASESVQSRIFAIADNMIRGMDKLEMVDGVSIVRTSNETPRALDGDFGSMLADRLDSFLRTHAVRMDLGNLDFSAGVEKIGRAMSDITDTVVEGRGKKGRGKDKKMKKMKNIIIPILLGVKAKMAIISAMAGNTIAMIAAKAILVSKIALILGVMLFLKKLLNTPPKDVTYQTIKHNKIVLPHHDHEEHHHEDWGQGRLDSYHAGPSAHEMAYGGQMKPLY